jgi:hypothetical protein
MARSKQTNAAATPATAFVRRTQASPPTNEEPPAQGSRRPRTSNAARSIRNNEAAEKAREIAKELAFQADIEAAVRAVSTVAEAKEGIKVAKQAIRNLEDDELGNNTEKNMGRATYRLKLYKERHDELEAALPTPLTADDNHDHTGKGKGKGKATAQFTSAPQSPTAGSGGQPDPQDKPLRRSLRNRRGRQDSQASHVTSGNQDPADPDSDDNLPSEQRWSPHKPTKYWDIHGITRESRHHYKICWKGTTEDGERWDDLWLRKAYVCQKAYDDWQKRKGDPRMWKVFEN